MPLKIGRVTKNRPVDGGVAPPPSSDDEHGMALVADAARPHEQNLVLPDLTLPSLRLEVQLHDLGVRMAVAALNAPREARVGLGDERRESLRILGAPFLAGCNGAERREQQRDTTRENSDAHHG
jgi:hypothetical protein